MENNKDNKGGRKKRTGVGVWECDEVSVHIPLYLAEELSSQEMVAVRKHLGSCSACRLALEAETRLNLLLRQALRPQVDPSYWEKVWPRVQVALVARRERRPRLRVLRWVFAGASAAAAAAGLLTFLLLEPARVQMLSRHDASYFAGLPSTPLLEQKGKDKAAFELAALSIGHSTPTERVLAWQNLEGR